MGKPGKPKSSLCASFLPEPRHEQGSGQLGTLTLPESHRLSSEVRFSQAQSQVRYRTGALPLDLNTTSPPRCLSRTSGLENQLPEHLSCTDCKCSRHHQLRAVPHVVKRPFPKSASAPCHSKWLQRGKRLPDVWEKHPPSSPPTSPTPVPWWPHSCLPSWQEQCCCWPFCCRWSVFCSSAPPWPAPG